MGNYIIVDGVNIGGKDSGIEIISVPQPSAAVKRFKKETLWGRDGFVADGEDAYDGTDGTIEILTRGQKARAEIISLFSTKCDKIDMYINSEKYYRTAKIVTHDMEILSDKDALHILSVAFQPFYTLKINTITNFALYKNKGDVDALPVITLTGSRGAQINLGGFKMQMGDSTMVVDSYNRTITNHMGKPITRDALRNADLSKYKFSNTQTDGTSGVQTGSSLKYTGTNPAQRKEYRGSVVRSWGFPTIPPQGLLTTVTGASIDKVQVYERYILPPDVEEWIGRG